MSAFYVYEDRTVHTATVHHGDCRWCNHGAGQWGSRDERASTWHGPYSSGSEVMSAPIRPDSVLRDCGSCRPDASAPANPPKASPERVESVEDGFQRAANNILALKPEFDRLGIQVYNSFNPELLTLLGGASAVAAFYAKALMETLGRRSGEALADLIHVRRNGETPEAHIGLPGDVWPKVVLTPNMPDEAWLTMFDLDVTSEDLRGKLLRWDSDASEWRPADSQ